MFFRMKLKSKFEISYVYSTLRIFHTLHFPHSSFSTLLIFHTPHFPHSSFTTLLIFHTPHFPHSSFSTLHIFHTPHSAIHTPLNPPNPISGGPEAISLFINTKFAEASLSSLMKNKKRIQHLFLGLAMPLKH